MAHAPTPLANADLDPDPLAQLHAWLVEAQAACPQHEAMALATADARGAPSVRMVLLKGADERGLIFFTGYESRKGRELAENPRAAAVLYWRELGRQVRVEGRVSWLPADESDAYFASRPPGSRISAAVSPQSRVVPDRAWLERAAELFAGRGDDVSRPESWGGYVLSPEEWEFWLHRDDRLHDRFRYRRDGDGWLIERLGP